MYKFIVPLEPITKKNHQRILKNRATGRPFVAQSKRYKQYEHECAVYLKPLNIDYPINLKALYYMGTRRKVDKTNLESALCDVLVKAGVLADDNSRIVVSTDGSRVLYDKENPRTEIYITEAEE